MKTISLATTPLQTLEGLFSVMLHFHWWPAKVSTFIELVFLP